MRWKTWQPPADGTIETVKLFALFPVKLEDGYTVWLENYFADNVWHDNKYDVTGHWLTLRRYQVDYSIINQD